jgi:transcriptional regulator with XRE-family HTH domain
MEKKSDAIEFREPLGGRPLTFGRFIRSIRLGEEQSLKTFAIKLGVSRQTLSDIEQERRSVSVVRATAWAKKLGYAW